MKAHFFLILFFAMGLPPMAPAAIIYTEGFGGKNAYLEPFVREGRPYTYVQDIDMNGDGSYDFFFAGGGSEFRLVPAGANRIISIKAPLPDLERDVVAFREWAAIAGNPTVGEWTGFADSWNDFDDGGSILFSIYTEGIVSNVPEIEPFYLGLEYTMDDGVHYGWINLLTGLSSTDGAYILGWAYESDPGKPILTGAIPEPSPAVLGLAGAAVLVSRRRRRPRAR